MAWLTEVKRLNKETAKKEVYFAIQWREGGKTRTRGIGFIQLTEAKQLLKMFEGRLASGEAVEPTSTAPGSAAIEASVPEGRTLGAYLAEVYLPVVARDKAAGTARSARCAQRSLTKEFGNVSLGAITFKLVDAYFTKRRSTGRRPRTVAIELWLLRGCLQHAVNCGDLPSGMPLLPTVRTGDRYVSPYLTPEQSVRVLEALRPGREQPHVVTRGAPPLQRDRLTFTAVLMALNTGMRKGEILTRGWEDVRWSTGTHGTIIVAAKSEIGFEVKTRRSRAIPLTPDLRAELAALHREVGTPERGWIFPADHDASVPRRDFKKGLANACRRAGVPVVHPHALRHTWATRLATAGVDRRTLMDLGGWTSSSVLDEIYSHAPEDHKVGVMARTGLGLGS